MQYPVYIVASFAAHCFLGRARKAGPKMKNDIPEEEMWFR